MAMNYNDPEPGAERAGWDEDPAMHGFEVDGDSQDDKKSRLDRVYTKDIEREQHRHGTWPTAYGHIITAVIGAGVLSLSYSIGVLGWVGGMAVMITFALITWYTSALLADCYVYKGERQPSYTAAVEATMGRTHSIIIAIVQYFNLFLTAVAYNITGATSLQLVVCPAGAEGCSLSYNICAVIFAGVQLFISQIPNMDSLWWVSAIGAIMSFGYSIIGMVLSAYYISEYGSAGGSVGGIQMTSVNKLFSIFNALGAIIFAYSFSFILIEIAETLKSDVKGPIWHMKKAVNWALVTITFFYLAVGSMGYAAFGNNTCSNILTCFAFAPDGETPSSIPTWVIRMVNAMVLVHIIPAYAVFSQPFFAFVERAVRHHQPRCLPKGATTFTFRIVWRSFYVGVALLLAIAMPFFGDVVGLIGALGFWPATVLYPIEMYIVKHQIRRSTARWWWLETINVFCAIISVLAVIGSIRQITVAIMDDAYTFF